jgi:hypothetical protein
MYVLEAKLKEPSNWDKFISYILFAYREVPNETTGFSSFELLYDRHVRGPLGSVVLLEHLLWKTY